MDFSTSGKYHPPFLPCQHGWILMVALIVATCFVFADQCYCTNPIQNAPFQRRGGVRKQRRIPVITRPRQSTCSINTPRLSSRSSLKIITGTSTCTVNQPLKVALLNARSVCNKTATINEYIVSSDIDVLVITETWLHEFKKDILCQLIPAGYLHLKENRSKSDGGGGILIIYKQNMNMQKLPLQDKPHTFELMEVRLLLDNQSLKFFIIYRPPYSTKNRITQRQFLDEFHDFLLDRSIHSTDTDHPILLGDFNLHVNDSNNPYATEFHELISSFNLSQRVTGPTHEKGNTLDLVITDVHDHIIKTISVENNGISDHDSVVLNLNLAKPKKPQKAVIFRDTKRMDLNELRMIVRSANIQQQIEGESSVDEQLKKVNDTLTVALDHLAPQKEKIITIRPNTRWFSQEISTLKQARRKAERLWRKTKLTVHKDIFRQAKLKVNNAIKKAKKDYLRKSIEEQKGNSRELFKILNNLVKHVSSSQALPSHSDELALANKFADYFTTKIETIRHQLDNSVTSRPIDVHDTNLASETLSNFAPVSPAEIKEIISKSPNKSCQLDPIPTWIMKACSDELSVPIALMINLSLTSSKVPGLFKEAHVKPLLKKPSLDQECLKNFRPISNLNFLSKVAEKVVAQRLKDHLSANGIVTPLQSAYIANHSTETALLRVTNDILCSLNRSNNVVLLLLDLSAAFDTIDHRTLIDRLEKRFGITGHARLWIEDYLSLRYFRININGTLSDPVKLNFGVPQGSVLGPLLFTLYTSPLTDVITMNGLGYHLYADDSQLYVSISPENVSDSTAKIKNCVEEIKTWMTFNKLKLNQDKTELIVFKKSGSEFLLDSIELGNSRIQRSDYVKNLGCILDSNMSFNEHITRICQSVHYQLCIIGRIRQYMDCDSARLLVHALITSRLDYCNSLLYGLPSKSISRLQKLQNKSARLITMTKAREHITPILKSLHWLPVELRVRFKLACIIFKCIHGLAPPYLQALISVYRPVRALRSTQQVQLVRTTPLLCLLVGLSSMPHQLFGTLFL